MKRADFAITMNIARGAGACGYPLKIDASLQDYWSVRSTYGGPTDRQVSATPQTAYSAVPISSSMGAGLLFSA